MSSKPLLVPFLLLLGCMPVDQIGSLNIDTSCNLCIVEGEINGKKAYFIMDTGAGLTTFDINQAKHFGFSAIESDLSVGAFNNNTASVQEAAGITSIRINKVEGDRGTLFNRSKLSCRPDLTCVKIAVLSKSKMVKSSCITS